jgi:hypothetical protein
VTPDVWLDTSVFRHGRSLAALLGVAALDSFSSSSPVVGQSSLYSSSSAEFGQASRHQQPGDFMQVNLIDFSDKIGPISVANDGLEGFSPRLISWIFLTFS